MNDTSVIRILHNNKTEISIYAIIIKILFTIIYTFDKYLGRVYIYACFNM